MVNPNALALAAGVTVIYILFACIAVIIRLAGKKAVRSSHELLKLALAAYLGLLLSMTLMPLYGVWGRSVHNHATINLVPFRTIFSYFRWARPSVAIQDIITNNFYGNIAVFLPMGFLLPTVWPGFARLRRCLLFGMLFSAGIEILQLVISTMGFMSRTTDIDDVILNTLGAMVGYGLYICVKLLMKTRNDKSLPEI